MAGIMDLDPRLRFLGIWAASVLDNDDPENLHRVRFQVPGLIEKSPWAMPAGVLADHEEGSWAPPRPGMNVWAAFVGGDPKRPIYLPGPWGEGDQPFESIRQRGIRINDFQLMFDEEVSRCTLEDRTLGIKVEIDRVGATLTLYAPAELKINSTGTVRIVATGCEILGRPVVPGGGPI